MEFSIKVSDITKVKTDCVMVGVFENKKLSQAAALLNTASGGALAAAIAAGDISCKIGTTLVLQAVAGVTAKRVMLLGFGDEKAYNTAVFCKAIGAGFTALKATSAADATVALNANQSAADLATKIEQSVIDAIGSAYRCDGLKSKKNDKPIGTAVTFLVSGKLDDKSSKAAKDAITRGSAIGEGMSLTRHLGDLPPNICTPTYLAETAKELAKAFKFKATILEKKDMQKLGMNTLLSVSASSYQPPKFIVLEHNGGKKGAAPIVLIGKGITFDTGGISLKPAAEMDEMKFDMCGAAAMFGTMKTVGLMKLPLNVVMLVPTCENMPGGNATRPGDIVTSMKGLTVEILNTDAEGRLILCDAMTYAERFKPACVVDAATLTGAIIIALGNITTGVFANDDALASELVAAGTTARDAAWQLPINAEYDEMLKSNFADIPNISGGRAGGSITAACFLNRFAGSYKWAHLDIAGTASKSGAAKGATGRPVPLLSNFLFKRAGL